MTTFFTSDLHLGHSRVIELCNRPFLTVDEMNSTLIANWNEVVKSDDIVYILGDLALGTIKETMMLVPKLAGKKFLVPGNHDRVWSGYPNKPAKAQEMRELYESAGLTILSEQVRYIYEYEKPWWKLCHFPISGDSYTNERYPEYRPTIDGSEWLIHGHVHNMWKVKDRQINVGVDVWDFTPVPREQLELLIMSNS